MAKIMDPILPILSILGYQAIVLGSFGGAGLNAYETSRKIRRTWIDGSLRSKSAAKPSLTSCN